jgi:hypothetical protein
LHSHQQCVSVSASPHPCQHLLLLLPLIMAILTGVRWNLSVVLIWISFTNREVECYFMYLLVICTSLRIPCLIHVPISSLGCWFFGGWVFWVSCRFWMLVFYWVKVNKDFLPLCGLSLESVDCFFCCAEALLFDAVPFVHCFS